MSDHDTTTPAETGPEPAQAPTRRRLLVALAVLVLVLLAGGIIAAQRADKNSAPVTASSTRPSASATSSRSTSATPSPSVTETPSATVPAESEAAPQDTQAGSAPVATTPTRSSTGTRSTAAAPPAPAPAPAAPAPAPPAPPAPAPTTAAPVPDACTVDYSPSRYDGTCGQPPQQEILSLSCTREQVWSNAASAMVPGIRASARWRLPAAATITANGNGYNTPGGTTGSITGFANPDGSGSCSISVGGLTKSASA